MSISVTDFVNGVDFDAYGTQTAQMHNQLVSLGTVWTDKGLVIRSIDTAANTPDVPDATVTTKWKRYIWLRIPHTSVVPPASTVPFFYAWNDTATSVAIYLKWQRIQADFTTVNATIAALQAELDASQLDITAATLTANGANSIAGDAQQDATDALANAAIVAGNLATLDAQVNHTTSGLAPTRSVADTALGLATAAVTPAQLAAAVAIPTASLDAKTIYTNSNFALVIGSTYSFNHNFTATPKYVRWVMYNITPEHGYTTNDEVDILSVSGTSGSNYPCFVAFNNVTAVKLYHGHLFTPQVLRTSDGTSQLITLASWGLRCYYAKE